MANIQRYFSEADRSRARLGQKRIQTVDPNRFIKANNLSDQDRNDARSLVERRLERIEKSMANEEFKANISQSVIDMARQQPMAFLAVYHALKTQGAFEKAFDVTPSPLAGLQPYDLSAPAKMLYPVLCPIRNMLPRTKGMGSAHSWRAVLAVDDTNVGIGVQTGARGGVISQRDVGFTVPYRTIGLENFVTFESQSATQGYTDVLALAVLQTLQALMIREEQALIAGIGLPSEISGTSFAFGACPTPTLTTATTGGSLAAATAHYVVCVAMSLDATTRFPIVNNASTTVLTNAIATTITRTNADGTTATFNAGYSMMSAQATVTTGAGSTNSITAKVQAVPNAYAYLWGIATASGGPYKMAAITNLNTVTLTSLATGNQNIPSDLASNDRSANVLMFDGIYTQSLGSLTQAALGPYTFPTTITSNAYYTGTNTQIEQTGPFWPSNYISLDGAQLTPSSGAGVNELDNMLQWAFDVWKGTPQTIFISSSLQRSVTNAVIGGGGAPLFRFVGDNEKLDARTGITANAIVANYLNPYFGTPLTLVVHPYLSPGKALFFTRDLPYQMANIGNLVQVRSRRDYYAQEWPLVTRKYQYGVYSEQLVEVFFPMGFQVLDNVGFPTGQGPYAPSITQYSSPLPAGYV
jgi:hypothetical protein